MCPRRGEHLKMSFKCYARLLSGRWGAPVRQDSQKLHMKYQNKKRLFYPSFYFTWQEYYNRNILVQFSALFYIITCKCRCLGHDLCYKLIFCLHVIHLSNQFNYYFMINHTVHFTLLYLHYIRRPILYLCVYFIFYPVKVVT